MGLLFWKNNKPIDAFARTVADDLFSHVQPDIAREYILGTGALQKKQSIKVEKKISDVLVQIKRFSASNSLGIYGKARLQRSFNERLGELGYPVDVVNKLAESILLRNV